jgi:hypothetical protein
MSNRYLPFVTRTLTVSTEEPPLEFCPEVKLGTYSIGQGFVEATQFLHSLPYDRHVIRVRIDSTDYQTAIDAASIPGTLTTNFVSAWITKTNGLPGGVPIGTPEFLTPEVETFGLEFHYYFRPLPNWTTKYLNVTVLFNHNGQDDYMVVPVVLNLAPYNQTSGGVSYVVSPDDNKVFQNGVAVDELCEDGEVEIKFEVCGAGASMSLVVIHERDGEFAGEWDRYDSLLGTELPTLTDGPVTEIDFDTATCKTITTKLDEGNLQSGDCFYYLFKAASSEPPGCEDEFCIIASIDVTPGISQIVTIDWDSDLAEAATYSFNFEHLDQSGYPSSVTWSSTDATGSFSQAISFLNAEIITLTITVVLENGCTYLLTWQEQLVEGQTITNEICN